MAPTKTDTDPDDAPLKRLGGGRWQSRDDRFTIEPQSGTWVVVDAEQTDDLGLPLVRGPFASLTAAKEAISGARSSEPASSPLAARIKERASEPATRTDDNPAAAKAPKRPRASDDDAGSKATSARRAKPKAKPQAEPQEPVWLADLPPADRGRARRQIETLGKLGIDDPEGVVRRDVVGDVAAIAAAAVKRQLAELDDDAVPHDVAELLADGRDSELGVRWRLVDGDGRPITLEPRGTRRRS